MHYSQAVRRNRLRAAALRRGPVFALIALLLLTALPVARAVVQTPGGGNARKTEKAARAEFVPGEVLVRFRSDAPLAAETKVARRGLALRSRRGREIAAEVGNFDGSDIVKNLRLARVAPEDTLDAVEAMRERPDVLYAEPNYIWRKSALPNDARLGDLWGLRNTGQPGFNDATGAQAAGAAGEDVDAEAAWDTTVGSRGVVVAVIDEGVDVNHPDLQPNIWVNPGEAAANGLDDDGNGFVDDVNGWDFTTCSASTPLGTPCGNRTVYDGTPTDGVTDSHGTHVAGTIGAAGNNGRGVAGVNWQVSIMSVKVLGPNGGSTSNIIRGYNYVRKMRAEKGVNVRVTNNSYGGPGFSQSAFDAVGQLNQAGILFVAAAGNAAQDNFSFPQYPSDYDLPNVVSVAATDRFGQLAVFSNYGARRVHLGAPGRSILSTTPNDTYSSFNGTSMAAPHVAGAAALVLSVMPDTAVRNLRGAVVFGGDPLPSLLGNTTTGRRLNLAGALRGALENDLAAPAAPSDLQVAGQSGRSVTLRWSAPGDDGDTGTAADYDFFFVYPDGRRLSLPAAHTPGAAGEPQSVTLALPYRNLSGTVELKTYDNAGNSSTAGVPVALGRNAASVPYEVSLGAAEALSAGGTALGVVGDDVFKENQPLPFAFPFYGRAESAVTLSSNGALYFSKIPRDGGVGLDSFGSVEGLQGQSLIAGLWDDLRTDRGGNVYMVQPDSGRVIFRWEAVTFNNPLSNGTTRGEQPVNFEIELRSDGAVVLRYGAGQSAPTNTRLFPVVGVSGGEPDAYGVASHTSEYALANLTNAQTVTFTPTPSVHTIGGRVTENGLPKGGVAVSLSGSQTATAQTDANGDYSFPGLAPGGNYTVTPALSGYNFTPQSQSFNAVSSDQSADFSAAAVPTPTPTPTPTPAPVLVNHALSANGAAASASSTLDSTRLPVAAVNGDRRGLHWGSGPTTGSGWTDATKDAFPDRLEVTFPAARTVEEVSVIGLQDNFQSPVEPTETMTSATYALTSFQVEYWTGSAWALVPGGAVTGNNKVWRKLSFAPVTTTKVRLTVSAAQANYSRVVELEAWGPAASGPPPRVNVAASAHGATAVASSTLDSTRLPVAAINGDRKGLHWGSGPTTGSGWTDATKDAFPDRLEITFAGAKAITEVSVFGLQDNFQSPVEPTEALVSNTYALQDFDVEYWTGSAWQIVPGGLVMANDKVWRKITFPALTTTKVRVSVRKALANYSRIVEVEAY